MAALRPPARLAGVRSATGTCGVCRSSQRLTRAGAVAPHGKSAANTRGCAGAGSPPLPAPQAAATAVVLPFPTPRPPDQETPDAPQ